MSPVSGLSCGVPAAVAPLRVLSLPGAWRLAGGGSAATMLLQAVHWFAKGRVSPGGKGEGGEITGRDTHLHPDRLGGCVWEWAEGRQTEEAEADRRGGESVSKMERGPEERQTDSESDGEQGSRERWKGQRKALDQGEEKPSEGREMLRNGGRA